MAAGCVWLRAIDMSRFENPLESSNTMLFVKLWTLSQIGDALKILHFEKIASALGTRRDQFGGDDFCEPSLRQKLAVESEQCRLNAKYITHTLIAKRQGTVLDQRVWVHRLK